jgi:hypothetical protein
MKRRAFLQLLALLPVMPLLRLPLPEVAHSDSTQFVFDGVNGLTFPATVTNGCLPMATRIMNLRALTFLERVLGGVK